ncbi:MAG TPA: TetR/AcrR family transcriptional regulator [Phycisphaerales bacterium]|nr:TetR/AcrR family transcriptional regulator [Phycisphaerales bacterium]
MVVGRPRQFDVDEALEKAMSVFWRKGYEGASMPELTKAMGINRPSLYAAFGNKQALFRKAIARYTAGPACYVREALELSTAKKVIQRLFAGEILMMTEGKNPKGCLVVQGALACSESAKDIQQELADMRARTETALRERLIRAKREGDLPRGASPAEMSKYVMTVMHGMAVQAASGASRRELEAVADMAIRACGWA